MSILRGFMYQKQYAFVQIKTYYIKNLRFLEDYLTHGTQDSAP